MKMITMSVCTCIGLQVAIKPHYKDAGTQCTLLTSSVTTSTPIKRGKVPQFPASESELSEVDDPAPADVSSSVYYPSQESSQS